MEILSSYYVHLLWKQLLKDWFIFHISIFIIIFIEYYITPCFFTEHNETAVAIFSGKQNQSSKLPFNTWFNNATNPTLFATSIFPSLHWSCYTISVFYESSIWQKTKREEVVALDQCWKKWFVHLFRMRRGRKYGAQSYRLVDIGMRKKETEIRGTYNS